MTEIEKYVAPAKAAAERANSTDKSAVRESYALAAIANAIIALVEVASIAKARDTERTSE